MAEAAGVAGTNNHKTPLAQDKHANITNDTIRNIDFFYPV